MSDTKEKDEIYQVSPPEFIGKIPPRKEIEIEPSKKEAGWSFQCYSGVEVYHKPNLPDPKTEEELANYIAQLKEPIKDRNLKPGTEIVFQSLFGGLVLVSATIVEENGTLYAENENSIYSLSWDIDDRHCWSSSTGFNKKALRKVQ